MLMMALDIGLLVLVQSLENDYYDGMVFLITLMMMMMMTLMMVVVLIR